MTKFTTAIVTTALAIGLAGPGFAQTVAPMASNQAVMADHSMRSSKLLGMTVYNDRGAAIGAIDDVLVAPAGGETRVIVAVRNSLGNDRLVAIPVSRLKLDASGHMSLAGIDQEILEQMAVFHWGNG